MNDARTRPIIGCAAGVTVAMLTAYLLTNNLDALEWGPRKTWLIAMTSGAAGSLCGTMSGLLFNPRLAGYWVWFFLAMVGVGFAPVVPSESGREMLWTGTLSNGGDWILLHTVSATLVAMVGTFMRPFVFGTPPSYTPKPMSATLWAVGVFGLLGLALTWFDSSPSVWLTILAPPVGRQVCAVLTYAMARPMANWRKSETGG